MCADRAKCHHMYSVIAHASPHTPTDSRSTAFGAGMHFGCVVKYGGLWWGVVVCGGVWWCTVVYCSTVLLCYMACGILLAGTFPAQELISYITINTAQLTASMLSGLEG